MAQKIKVSTDEAKVKILIMCKVISNLQVMQNVDIKVN